MINVTWHMYNIHIVYVYYQSLFVVDLIVSDLQTVLELGQESVKTLGIDCD